MSDRDGTAIGIHVIGSIRQPELPGHGEHLSRESFVDFDDIDLRKLETCQRQHLLCRGHRTDSHDARLDACDGRPEHTGARPQRPPIDRGFAREQQRAAAIVDARSIACSDGAVGFDDRLQFRECFEPSVGPWMLIAGDDGFDALAFERHGHDFGTEETTCLRTGTTLLTAPCKRILVLTRNAEFTRQVLRRLGHGIDAIQRTHARIHEAPSEGGVFDLRRA